MKRKEAIKVLQGIACRMAEKYGFTEMTIGKDRQKGIWGEGFTEFLESQHGDCSTVIRWTRPDKDGGEYVEFRYRFASPVICIKFWEGDRETMANLEFHDYLYKDMGEVYEEDTTFYEMGHPKLTRVDIPMELGEIMLWNPKVARAYAQEMEEMWDEANKEREE